MWSCTDFVADLGTTATCGFNAISWTESTESWLLSSFDMETVFEVDRATSQATRWFGHLTGSWSFDPSDSVFWWQHGANITESGTLLLSTRISEEGSETVVREYELDEGAETLRQVWTFGEGEGIHAETLGEAERLPGGNTQHNLGSALRLREVTPEGEVVWDLEIEGDDQYLARSETLESLYAFLDGETSDRRRRRGPAGSRGEPDQGR